MANYFYVCTNGTFTGTRGVGENAPYTAAQTGTMSSLGAANVYPSLAACFNETKTAPPKDGDFVMVASDHDVDTDPGGDIFVNNDGDNLGDAILTVLSVDVTDITKYLPGAVEGIDEANDSDDWTFDSHGIWAGVSLRGTDNVIASSFSMRHWYFQDLTLTMSNAAADTGDFMLSSTHDGCRWTFRNVDMDNAMVGSTKYCASMFNISSGCQIDWRGGSLLNSGGSTEGFRYLTQAGAGGSGGCGIYIEGVDLSPISYKLDFGLVSSTNTDYFPITIKNCILNSSITWPDVSSLAHPVRFTIVNSDDSTNKRQHRFCIAQGGGKVFNNDSVYVTATEPWYEGSVKSSLQVITSDRVHAGLPFQFEMPSEFIDLSVGTTDKVGIHICTDFTLYDKDIHFFLRYADGTTPVQGNWLSEGSSVVTNYGGANPHPSYAGTEFNTTGALTAADWTGEPTTPTPKFYYIEFDTTTDAGAACVPTILCEVIKKNIDGTAGNKLYINSEIKVSG